MARKGKAPASTAVQQSGGKSGEKSGKRPGTFTGADDPRRGRGPKKGAPNAGRPPDEFKRIMRGISSRKEVIARLRKLTGKSKTVPDELFLKAWEKITDRGYGKAVQPLEHSGPDGEPIPVETADKALGLVLSELAGIAARKRSGKDSSSS